MTMLDVCLATDARFPGGSSSSTAEELEANLVLGYSTAFHHTRSSTLKKSRPFNPKIQAYLWRNPAALLPRSPTTPCRLLFFRQPSVLHPGCDFPNVAPQRIIVIVNHPMRNSQGRIDFNLLQARKRLVDRYKIEPEFRAISQGVRSTYDSRQRALISEQPWFNVFRVPADLAFDTDQRVAQVFERKLVVVGRHSRDGVEKWPETPAALRAAYPADDGIQVEILGGADVPMHTLGGRLPANWTVFPFGGLHVADFLGRLDVFVYFHHSRWIEAFGRVIAEAMAAGVPCILPRYLEDLYGQAALYCEPAEVRDVVRSLRGDAARYRDRMRIGLDTVRQRFSWASHQTRMNELLGLIA